MRTTPRPISPPASSSVVTHVHPPSAVGAVAPLARPDAPRGAYAVGRGSAPALPLAATSAALDGIRARLDALEATASTTDLGRLAAQVRAARGAIGSFAADAPGAGALHDVVVAAGVSAQVAASRVSELARDPTTPKATAGVAARLVEELRRLGEASAALARELTPDIGRPVSTLPRFDVEKFWDADSTPGALAALSRVVGRLAPHSGGRTPQIEAAIVMASLMHDVSYYYGGWSADKDRADQVFGAQIPYFAQRLDPEAGRAARVSAAIDVTAVQLGGGVPFRESYSWSYGFEPAQRGYATLDPGQLEQVQQIARETFREVVAQIALGRFHVSDVLAAKLAKTSPEYRAALEANVIELCRSLHRDLEAGRGSDIPGF